MLMMQTWANLLLEGIVQMGVGIGLHRHGSDFIFVAISVLMEADGSGEVRITFWLVTEQGKQLICIFKQKVAPTAESKEFFHNAARWGVKDTEVLQIIEAKVRQTFGLSLAALITAIASVPVPARLSLLVNDPEEKAIYTNKVRDAIERGHSYGIFGTVDDFVSP